MSSVLQHAVMTIIVRPINMYHCWITVEISIVSHPMWEEFIELFTKFHTGLKLIPIDILILNTNWKILYIVVYIIPYRLSLILCNLSGFFVKSLLIGIATVSVLQL